MKTPVWLYSLETTLRPSPGFLAALDQQLRRHALELAGVDLARGDFSLREPDTGFEINFHGEGGNVVGVLEAVLIDPSAFGHQVAMGWRATGAPDHAVWPNEERDDLEFVWLKFPVAELSVSTALDSAAVAAAVTAAFPIEWDVHHWASVWLTLRSHHVFSTDEHTALAAVIQRAAADWNMRQALKIHYLADPDVSPDHATLRQYIDLGSAGPEAVVAVLNALGAAPAASAIARCIVGRRRR